MTALLFLLIIGLSAVAGLLWCLAGFSRALKEKPKVIGLLVRAGNNDSNTTKRLNRIVIPFPDHFSLAKRVSATRLRTGTNLENDFFERLKS